MVMYDKAPVSTLMRFALCKNSFIEPQFIKSYQDQNNGKVETKHLEKIKSPDMIDDTTVPLPSFRTLRRFEKYKLNKTSENICSRKRIVNDNKKRIEDIRKLDETVNRNYELERIIRRQKLQNTSIKLMQENPKLIFSVDHLNNLLYKAKQLDEDQNKKIDVRLPKPTSRKLCKLPPIKMGSSRQTIQKYASLSVKNKSLSSKPTLPKITKRKQMIDKEVKKTEEDLLQDLDKISLIEPENIRSILANRMVAQDSSSQNESIKSSHSMFDTSRKKQIKLKPKPGVRWGKDTVQLFLSHN